jgi:predicted P-loop ATPase/GTPase
LIPDVLSLNINEARKRIYLENPDAVILIRETINRRHQRYSEYSISETIVIRQKIEGEVIELTVAYTTLQL